MRREFVFFCFFSVMTLLGLTYWNSKFIYGFYFILPILIFGFYDYFQTKHAIKRNFPILGRFRYWLEAIRPEIQQYFVENNTDGRPFTREQRSLVYQRAKNNVDTLPFGTQKDVYDVGYEWVKHSIKPTKVNAELLRVKIGGENCKQPYDASIFNIAAMSFGSLSKNAVLALNSGAKAGNFAHNTGEGGVSPYHIKPGGDLIWQIGTGYFGCRDKDGKFDPDKFTKQASLENIKMIELKLSQGAKPGHGGILPGAKVTHEIAEIRGVEPFQTVHSPPYHTAFNTPLELVKFIKQLQDLSGGKPVGFKFCLGKFHEFMSICKAMIELDIYPDYICVDGGEGGTGAAPLEFSNHIGAPVLDSLLIVNNILNGFNIRDKVTIIAAGKVSSGFGMLKLLALGADVIYSARAMMMAIGCIQALRCNNNDCPAGVATQDRHLNEGLVVKKKEVRVKQFHAETVSSLAHIMGAMGLVTPAELKPWHIMRRVSAYEVKNYMELFTFMDKGAFLSGDIPSKYEKAFEAAHLNSFRGYE